MTYLEYVKTYGNLDQVIMVLKQSTLTDAQTCAILDIPRQTIYNVTRRQKTLVDILNTLGADDGNYPVMVSDKELQDIVKSSNQPDNKELFYKLVHELGFSDKVRFTDGRKRKLVARRRAYTSDDLVNAAQNISGDDFMSGNNDNKVKYGTIDYLLRNDEIVDKWLQNFATSSSGDTITPDERERILKHV